MGKKEENGPQDVHSSRTSSSDATSNGRIDGRCRLVLCTRSDARAALREKSARCCIVVAVRRRDIPSTEP
jgi:hypothetical protein